MAIEKDAGNIPGRDECFFDVVRFPPPDDPRSTEPRAITPRCETEV